MITFQEEKFKEVIDEIKPLLESHYEEIAMYKDQVPFDPDYERYSQMCDLGVLHVVTARDEGRIVGYYISFIVPHIHYKTTMYANNDILFLHPDYRGTTAAPRMFKFAEKALKDKGVDVMMIHMKTYSSFDRMLERMGWDYTERLYTKCIKEA